MFISFVTNGCLNDLRLKCIMTLIVDGIYGLFMTIIMKPSLRWCFFFIIYKALCGNHEPTNSKFNNKMNILCSVIFIRDFLDGPKMRDDALMWKLVDEK
jgi:hypothetical protein